MATPTREHRGRVRPRYARTGLLGLSLITLVMVTLAAIIAVREPSELVFVGPLLIVAAVATGLVWRFDATWARIVGIVATLGVGFMTWWLAFGILYPQSAVDFSAGVAMVVGVVLSLFGNIAAIVQRRRDHLDLHAEPRERHIEQVAVGLVVLAVLVSGTWNLLARTSVDEAAAADAVAVDMHNFAFEPAAVEADGGASLLVHNTDPFMHDIAVPDLGIDAVDVAPGAQVLVDLPSQPGTYNVYCTLHSDTSDASPDPEMMVATLTVR